MINNNILATHFSNVVFGKFFFFFLFLYQITFLFWGIDFSDMGLSAVLYQQIFNDPQTVQFNFSIWLTGIIGGVWFILFEPFGLIGIRILGILVFTLMLLIVYSLLKNDFDKIKIKAGLVFITILIGPHFVFMGFHYDTLSALLLVMLVFSLFKGLKCKNNFYILLSGFFLALNVFVRIPNITGIAILLPAIYYGYKNNYTLKKQLGVISLFLLGFVIGLVVVAVTMKLLNHDEFFKNAFSEILNSGKSGNSHSVFSLLMLYVSQYITIFINIVIGISVAAIYVFAANKFKYKILYALPLLVGLVIYALISENDFMRIKELFIYHGFALLISLIYLFNKQATFNQRFLSLLGIFMMIILPLGSNYGIINMYGLSFAIAMPIAVCGFLSIIQFKLSENNGIYRVLNYTSISVTRITMVVVVIVASLFSTVYYSYCEATKTQLKYSINSRLSIGIYTSSERASVINELLKESSIYLKKDDYLLTYHGIPMIYFLTETKPWLYNIWTSVYSADKLDFFIKKSYSEKKVLPVIIKAKFTTWGNWPEEGIIDVTLPQSEADKFLDEMLIKKNDYKLVWENKAFQILIPPDLGVPE